MLGFGHFKALPSICRTRTLACMKPPDQWFSENGHRDTSWNRAADRLPSRDALVYYRTALYRFAGYIDGEGRWRDHNGRLEPEPVLGWAALGRD